MIKIFEFIIAYLFIAILTDLFLNKKCSDELEKALSEDNGNELIIVLAWPIFWIGYVIGYLKG